MYVSPGDDLATLARSRPEGTTFVLRPGVHREQTVRPRNGQSFVGEAGAILSGARRLTTFTREGALWLATDQAAAGEALGYCEDASLLCTHPEDLFVDDRPLRRVANQAAVRPGTWFFDYPRRRVYLADDPTGRQVELGAVPHAFVGPARVSRSAGSSSKSTPTPPSEAPSRPVTTGRTTGATGSSRATRSGGTTASACRRGPSMQALNNYIHHNGQIGIAGLGDDMRIECNEIAFNNTAGFASAWEAGGTKFVKTRRLVVRRNYVHHNMGPGLWTDIDNIDSLVEDNHVADNHHAGIFHEISYAAVIRRNRVARNGSAFHVWLWGAGIQIAASRDVQVYGNTVTDNANGITAIQQDRGAGAYGPWVVENLHVHDNVVTQTAGVAAGLAQDLGDDSVFTTRRNRFEGNIYRVRASSYAWMNRWLTPAEWRAHGLDVTGAWE